jgi:ABC-type antimicrobial peptide transport system permease subunit
LRRLRTLPPLSPITYYRRNISRTLPVGGAIVISVFLIASIVTLLNSVDASITRHYGFIRRFSVLTTQLAKDITPEVRARALALPQIKQTIPVVPYILTLKTVFGEMPVPVYGVDHKDMPTLAAVTGNKLVEGRWPEPNEPEIVLTRMWADNFNAKLGDTIGKGKEKLRLPSIPQKVVGILEGGENFAISDRTFFELTLPDPVIRLSYLLLPRDQDSLATINTQISGLLDHPTEHGLTRGQTQYARLYTFEGLVGELRESLAFLYKFLAVADALVIGAVALMGAFLANIYFEQRLGEFGLLSAFGFRRERLAKRVVVETGILVVFGWLAGMLLTWLLFRAIDVFYMTPRGLILAPIDALAIKYTLPTPFIVGFASLGTVLLRLYRLDPIEIMERR